MNQPHALSSGWGVVEMSWSGVLAAESLTGRRATYSETYIHWGGGWGGFATQAPALQQDIDAGVTPVVTWMSDDPTVSDQSAYTLRRIASGAWDAYALSWANGLRSLGSTVLFRFDSEMNGNWMSWSPGVHGQTTADYVAAWRHLHNLFTAAGATNVRWVWSPNVEYTGSTPFSSLYPGDGYVDWVALDGYNWGNTNGHSWQSFSGVFDASLASLERLTSKPVMLAEVGSAEAGGDKAAWIADMFAQLAARPDIRAFIWFDLDKETDWRIASSPASAAAFVSGLRRTLP